MGCSDPEFYTNTRPYLSPRKTPVDSKIVTGSSATNVTGTVPLSAKVKNLTSHIYAAEDLRSTDTPLPAHRLSPSESALPEQASGLRHPQPVFRWHELVFPKLPALTEGRDKSLDRYFERAVGLWSPRQDRQEQRKIESAAQKHDADDTIKDERSNFQQLWDAYEEAVLGLKSRKSNASEPVA